MENNEANAKKNDKLTDKAFVRLVATSILGILVCIICRCSTTGAWFGDTIPNTGNEIKTADACHLSVTVTGGTLTASLDGEITATVGSAVAVELKSDTEYTVTLTLPKDSASGYCLIEAFGKQLYTDYILRHESETPVSITFTLKVSNDTSVTFTPRWGIYSGDVNVKNGETLNITEG